MEKNSIKITEVKIYPTEQFAFDSLKANVKIVLNGVLVVHGLKIIKGQFGHFISYPKQSEASPYKFIETTHLSLRKEIHNAILHEYVRVLALMPC